MSPTADPTATTLTRFEVSAPTEAALVQTALDRVIARIAGPTEMPESFQVIGFRGVAPTLPALLATSIEAAFEEADVQGFHVVSADVSGVMATDEGLRCWGFVGVVPATDPSCPPEIAGTPTVERRHGTLVATFTIRLDGVGA
ncbi:MAG: hypothetical protein QM589_16245 [Thermomicrobiales bacterium]